MSLAHIPTYSQIIALLEDQFNQRLQSDYQHLLSQLSTVVSQDIISNLPPLKSVTIRLLDKQPPKMPTVPTCLALVKNHKRCLLKANSDHYCYKHQLEQPYGSLADLSAQFYPIPHPDYDMFNLTGQRGRKHYNIPKLIREYYLPVQTVIIDDYPYLCDQDGFLYGLTPEVKIIGRKVGKYIKWLEYN